MTVKKLSVASGPTCPDYFDVEEGGSLMWDKVP